VSREIVGSVDMLEINSARELLLSIKRSVPIMGFFYT
jgi:hypothetical protein